jgi:hypothetical protein
LVTVTHPHHPLCGQQLTLIRIRRGPDPDLIVRHPDGRHTAIRLSWTDFGSAPGPAADAAPLLDLRGLRQTVQLLNRIRQDGRWPTVPLPPDPRYDQQESASLDEADQEVSL